jgi:hypothetical protein
MLPKTVVWLLATVLLGAGSPAASQQRTKIHTIGYLGFGLIEDREKTFQQALGDHAWPFYTSRMKKMN